MGIAIKYPPKTTNANHPPGCGAIKAKPNKTPYESTNETHSASVDIART
jgi:hypothetical protein